MKSLEEVQGSGFEKLGLGPASSGFRQSVYVVGSGFADFESRVGVLFCRFWENNVNTNVMKWHRKK